MADKICSQFWGYQNIPVPVVAIGTNIIFTTGKIVNAPTGVKIMWYDDPYLKNVKITLN